MPRIGSNLNPVLKSLEAELNIAIEKRAVIQKTIISSMDEAAEADKVIEGFRRAFTLVLDASNKE